MSTTETHQHTRGRAAGRGGPRPLRRGRAWRPGHRRTGHGLRLCCGGMHLCRWLLFQCRSRQGVRGAAVRRDRACRVCPRRRCWPASAAATRSPWPTCTPGETVLDLGSGGGIDVLLSARRVGPTGKVYGLDMTDEMLQLARAQRRQGRRHQRGVPPRPDRGHPAARRVGRRGDLQLRGQPVHRQARGPRRDRPRAAPRRPDRDQRRRRRGPPRPPPTGPTAAATSAASPAPSRFSEYRDGLTAAGLDRHHRSPPPTRSPTACTAPSSRPPSPHPPVAADPKPRDGGAGARDRPPVSGWYVYRVRMPGTARAVSVSRVRLAGMAAAIGQVSRGATSSTAVIRARSRVIRASAPAAAIRVRA